MGARMLKKLVEQPSYDENVIHARLDAIEELKNKVAVCDSMAESFRTVYDIERLAGRLSYGNITPPDCLSLAKSFSALPKLQEALRSCDSPLLRELRGEIGDFSEEADLIFRAVNERAPAVIRDGNIIRDGYDAELDEYRRMSANSVKVIREMEEEERKLTGIKNLRIKHNKVFGYYIEVSNSQINSVPYRYIRKQTIAGGERYYTEELKILEEIGRASCRERVSKSV